MIQGLIIYILVGFLIVLRLSFLKSDIQYCLKESIGIYGTFLFALLFFPIFMLFRFYYWNFIECNQYGTKK